MTILAQQYIDNHIDTGTPFDENLMACLKSTVNIQNTATRIVFDEDLYSVLSEMVRNGQLDFSMLCRNAKLPTNKIWIEWKDFTTDNGRKLDFGMLISDVKNGKMMITCVNTCKNYNNNLSIIPQISCVFLCDQPPYAKGQENKAKILWTVNENTSGNRDDLWQEVNVMVLRVMVFAIFLLGQPKITENIKVEHSCKLQKKRREKKKSDLIEYQKINLKFNVLGSKMGNIVKRYDSSTGNARTIEVEKNGVRYHLVLGHFRCYYRDTDKEFLIWIDPHYRGDPSKGVLIRERTLTVAKGKINEQIET